MPIHNIFRLKNHALLMALSAAYPVMSYAVGAAQIDFAAGPVTAVSATGTQRQLTKGAEVGNGDTIRTGDGGRAQVRFSDGAMVSLQPATEFRIDNYQFANKPDGQEKGFFSLLKGGMRTITGLIGRSNRDNYKVTTSVATIGIRGTEYTSGLSPNGDELLVHTGGGLVEVCNGAGCVLLAAGESGVVGGKNEQPKRTDARPKLPPAQPDPSVLPVFSTSEILSGGLIPTSPMPTTGSAKFSSTSVSGLSLAKMDVTFGATTSYIVSLTGTGNIFNVNGSGSLSGNTFSNNSLTGSGSFCGCSCSGSVSGTFYGAGAQSVGISYQVTGSSTVTGTGLLTR